MTIAFAFLPILLTLLCGYVLAVTGTISKEGWKGIETLSFRLLIPAVLIHSIAKSDLSLDQISGMLGAVIATLCLATLAVFLYRHLRGEARLPNPDFTTLVQTTTRWNAFIALAAAELSLGGEMLVLIAAGMAVLIPLINIGNIIVLAHYGSAVASIRSVSVQVAKNPLVQGCVIGLAINLTDISLPDTVLQTLDIIGRAAIGIGVLTVGAALSAKRLMHVSGDVIAGVALRLVLCPALFLGCAQVMQLSSFETLSGVFILTVPPATNGYIIAKQMGGNADLYADILSWQTILSLIVLPLLAGVIIGG
ncbi:AEC family transporter [Shimia sp.]|uniref:AEC family transporter n=1 Tax=Shimia sp. TaxID=1954381 RepID=UPI003BAD19C5